MFARLAVLALAASLRLHPGHCAGQNLEELRATSDVVFVNTANGSVWALAPGNGPAVFCFVGWEVE